MTSQSNLVQSAADHCQAVKVGAETTAEGLRTAYRYRPDLRELKAAAKHFEDMARSATKARAALTRVVDQLEALNSNGEH